MQRREVARFAGPGASGRAKTREFWSGESCFPTWSKVPITNPRILNPDPRYPEKCPQKNLSSSKATCHLRQIPAVFAKATVTQVWPLGPRSQSPWSSNSRLLAPDSCLLSTCNDYAGLPAPAGPAVRLVPSARPGLIPLGAILLVNRPPLGRILLVQGGCLATVVAVRTGLQRGLKHNTEKKWRLPTGNDGKFGGGPASPRASFLQRYPPRRPATSMRSARPRPNPPCLLRRPGSLPRRRSKTHRPNPGNRRRLPTKNRGPTKGESTKPSSHRRPTPNTSKRWTRSGLTTSTLRRPQRPPPMPRS